MTLKTNGSIDLTVEEYVKLISMVNVSTTKVNVVNNTNETTRVKRGPGRPRKNTQQVEVVNPIDWLKKKEDVLHENIHKCKGWKCLNGRKDRSANTHKFYISLEFAEKAADALGIDKSYIYVIRPTAAAKDYEKYPKFYFIEQNWTNETTRDARCQYIQLWNRNHPHKLPNDISIHLSSKRVYATSYKRKAKMAK